MSILLKNIHKWFNRRLIISNVSLQVRDGELFVLLGGSGSGKSTLLRIIAGLIQPDSGKIYIDGRAVTHLHPQERNTGFVFQNYSLFRHMTVRENVEFGLRIRKIPPPERRKRSEELLNLVNLTGLGAHYANQLSGGQQQRVALARALAYNPGVLLLDEPFGALDVKIRAQLRKSLKDIQRHLKMTTILVTHDQEEAFELADTIGVVDYGQLLETGTSKTLYHYPRKEFTATFIGGGNVVVGRKEGNRIRLGAALLPMPENAPSHDEKVPVHILFRPETVLLQEHPFTPAQRVHLLGRGRIRELTFAGAMQRMVLEVTDLQGAQPLAPQPAYGQKSIQIVAFKTSSEYGQDNFTPGQSLWIGLRDYHVLDPVGFKVMVYTDESSSGVAAANFGLHLGTATGGSVTLMTVIEAPALLADARERLERFVRDAQPPGVNLICKVRQGNVTGEVVNEAYEGHYEVCILNVEAEAGRQTATNTWQRLVTSGMPVLLINASHARISNILICTAAGEPGKDDILFGGRIAKLTGARTTLLHIAREPVTIGEKNRVGQYLALGKASLEAMGVASGIIVKEQALPVEGIIEEMEAGNYDLLVIGAPAPKAPQRLVWTNMTSRIIAGTVRPVLIVPMLHE